MRELLEYAARVGDPPLIEDQARDLTLVEAGIGDVGERLAPPERQGGPQPRGSPLRIPRREGVAALLGQPLEPFEIELLGVEIQQIAGGTGDQDPSRLTRPAPRFEHLAKLGDVNLKGLGRRRGCLPAPQLIDQAIARDHLVRVEEEQREKRALLGAAQAERPIVLVADLQRP